MKKIFRWIGRRLREPTTYAGATVIAAAFGANVGRVSEIAQAVALIFGGGLVVHEEEPANTPAANITPAA